MIHRLSRDRISNLGFYLFIKNNLAIHKSGEDIIYRGGVWSWGAAWLDEC
jgi:hypothetical protein